jgi:hypothetical protein
MRKTHDHHHTPEEVEGFMLTALDIADRHGLDAEDRAAVLPVLVQLLSSKQVFYEQAAPLGPLDLNALRRGH